VKLHIVATEICATGALPLLLAACAWNTTTCEPPNRGWYDGVPLAAPQDDAAAKRVEVPAGQCAVYFYQHASYQNSFWSLDRVDVLPATLGTESSPPVLSDEPTQAEYYIPPGPLVRQTVNDRLYAVWFLPPGRYRMRVEATGVTGTRGSFVESGPYVNLGLPSGSFLQSGFECESNEAVFLADTRNEASIERVDSEVGRSAIQGYLLSAGEAEYGYHSGLLCLPVGKQPCGLENTPDCTTPR
jgi:hypothetical protein